MSTTDNTVKNFKMFFESIKPYLNGYQPAGCTPIGTIISVMGTVPPANYLACDGALYPIVTYPELAGYFKQQFGSYNYFGGDGTNTFAVPDLRGEFLRGTGTNSHENQGSGGSVGEHQDGTEIPTIYCNLAGTSSIFVRHDTSSGKAPKNMDSGLNSTNKSSGGTLTAGADLASNIADRYTTRPTNTSVLYCIATKNIYVDVKYDYSLDEKVVGTWIDGKPLYQKTITANMPTSSDQQTVAYSDSSIDCFVSYSGMAQDNNNRWKVNMPNTWGSDYIRAYWDISTKSFMIACNRSDYINGTLTITIQYTKITD